MRFLKHCRIWHDQGVQERTQMLESKSYVTSFNFIVRAMTDTPDTLYQIVDGAHRFFAAANIVEMILFQTIDKTSWFGSLC